MSSEVPQVDTPVERDPDTLGEEHEVDEAPDALEYSPELELDDPVREASPEDVVEQTVEVPLDDEATGTAEPEE